MKLPSSLVLAFLMISFFAQAQDITWGKTEKNNTLANTYSPLGYKDGFTFVYHGKFSGVTTFDGEFKGIIEAYDSNLNLVSTVELEKKKKGQKAKDVSEVEEALWTKDNILIIRSKYDKASDSKTLFSQVYNLKSKTAAEKQLEFGNIASTKKNKTTVNAMVSEDGSKILIYSEMEKIKGSPSEYLFYVLDTSGNLLWKRETTFGKSSDTKPQDILISDSGVIYAVISELDSRDDLEAVSVCYLGENERDDASSKITPNYELKFTSFQLGLSPSNTLVCASFHRDGCFYEEFDASLSKSIAKEEFNINQLSETVIFKTDRNSKTKIIGNELDKIEILNFTFHDDGSTTILGQFFNKKVVKKGTEQITYWYYYDLVAINFDASAKVAWSKRIPKRHMAMNSNKYVNVSISEFNDEIIIFYNDHIDNFETGIVDQNVRVKEAETVQVTITSSGELNKTSIFNGAEDKLLLDPWDSMKVSDDLFFMIRYAPVKGMNGLDKQAFGLMRIK